MRIHFFSVVAVADGLRAGALDAQRTFRYLAGWLAVGTVIGYYDMYSMGLPDTMTIAQGVIVLAITIYGLYRCYIANGGSSGLDLAGRFVALALPLTVRFAIGYEIVYWASFFTYPIVANPLSDEDYRLVWFRLDFVGSTVVSALWYWRMWTWLSRVASPARA